MRSLATCAIVAAAAATSANAMVSVIDWSVDGSLSPLVNGQQLTDSNGSVFDFGTLFTMTTTGNNRGATVFDSSETGPNNPGPDLDLLAGIGNLVMLQTSSGAANGNQTTPGIFDNPNDSAAGGEYEAERAADASRAVDTRLEAIVPTLAGRERQRRVFVRAQDMDQITAAVRWGAGRGLRVVIVGGRDAPLVSDLLVEHGVDVVLTGINTFPKRADSDFDAVYRVPAQLEAAGVRWCLSNGDDPGHERSMPHHAGKAIAFGLAPEAAWRALTLSGAEVLGVSDRVGSLEAGKDATLIVVDGAPWEVTTRVGAAFVGGREIDLGNKQSKLAEKYREKYRQLGVSRDE